MKTTDKDIKSYIEETLDGLKELLEGAEPGAMKTRIHLLMADVLRALDKINQEIYTGEK